MGLPTIGTTSLPFSLNKSFVVVLQCRDGSSLACSSQTHKKELSGETSQLVAHSETKNFQLTACLKPKISGLQFD